MHTVYTTPHTEVAYVINGPHVALAVRVIICANSSSIKDRASTTVYLWHRAAQWRRSGGAVAAQWRRSGDFVYDLYVGCSDKKPQTPRSAGYVNRQRRYAGRHRLEPLCSRGSAAYALIILGTLASAGRRREDCSRATRSFTEHPRAARLLGILLVSGVKKHQGCVLLCVLRVLRVLRVLHVLRVLRVLCVLRVLGDGELLVVGLLGGDDRGVGGEHDVDARVRDQVEGAVEAEGSGQGGNSPSSMPSPTRRRRCARAGSGWRARSCSARRPRWGPAGAGRCGEAELGLGASGA